MHREEYNSNNATLVEKNSITKKKKDSGYKPSYKILFVDDDNDILIAIKASLEYHGFIVDTFSNPLEALSSFKPEFMISF